MFSPHQIEDFAKQTWDNLPRRPDQPAWDLITSSDGKRNPFEDMRLVTEMHKKFVKAHLENDFNVERVLKSFGLKYADLDETTQKKQDLLSEMLKKLARKYK
jgi:hypothetical protein